MSILNANNLSITFGTYDVFAGLSASVANDAKIGLIGPNGIGKTSLLLILAGQLAPTTGEIALARGKRIGYLPQEAMEAFSDRTSTVYQEMLAVFSGLLEQGRQLQALEVRMSAGEWDEALLEAYGELQARFEHAGGYDYELRIQKTLDGLGLGKDAWDMPVSHLSGGQRTRLLLARLLLEQPDLLMLDEPTNHLDMDAVEFLERTLREWPGAVLIVSHDRFFLDSVVNTIWEMTNRSIEKYSGSYSSYLMQRQDRWEYLERVFEEEKERLLKEADFIQKNWVRLSSHSRALGMLKKISRELATVENYGIEALRTMKWHETGLNADKPLDMVEAIRKVNALHNPVRKPLNIRPHIKQAALGGNIVVHAHHATVGYPGNRLFQAVDAELRRGECAALIGPNGSGKTTFLRTLLGEIEPLKGEVRLGGGLKVGYFAQAHDALSGEQTVLDELISHKEMQSGPARSYLASYLFTGDDVFKPVSALSGGERARLALAILALEGANLLLLDEPTNHLDIPAQEALQEVLEDFTGTILIVSHDRYLVDRLATQIWELRNGRLEVFKGPYKEWVLRRSVMPANGNGKNGKTSATKARSELLLNRPLVKGADYKTRQRIQRLERLEERIRQEEAQVRKLSGDLEKAGRARRFERTHELSTQMAKTQASLESLLAEWESLAAQL